MDVYSGVYQMLPPAYPSIRIFKIQNWESRERGQELLGPSGLPDPDCRTFSWNFSTPCYWGRPEFGSSPTLPFRFTLFTFNPQFRQKSQTQETGNTDITREVVALASRGNMWSAKWVGRQLLVLLWLLQQHTHQCDSHIQVPLQNSSSAVCFEFGNATLGCLTSHACLIWDQKWSKAA